MMFAALSLMVNIYIVRLHEHRYTTRMSANMRFLIFRLIARIVGQSKSEVTNKTERGYTHYMRDAETSKDGNVGRLDIRSRQMFFSSDVTNDYFIEERQEAADILDRLFLFVFCIVFLTIAICSFAIN